MNIRTNQKASVFEIKESDKRKDTMTANISTFEGKNADGEFKYSSWRAYFVGDAYEKAKKLNNKDQILLLNAKVENNYNKEQERLYVSVTVFDFSPVV